MAFFQLLEFWKFQFFVILNFGSTILNLNSKSEFLYIPVETWMQIFSEEIKLFQVDQLLPFGLAEEIMWGALLEIGPLFYPQAIYIQLISMDIANP